MSEFTDELLADAKERMAKSVEACRHELATVRTGRASPHLLDRVVVDYYGTETPLRQLSQIAATDARLLTLTPYDKNAIKAIEKAILESDVGLTPSNDGNVIRLQIPELNEERRRDLVKVVHNVAEESRVAVRNIRRDVMHDLRELKKEGEVGEDDERRAEAELQKRTDGAISEIEALLKAKEEEILEVYSTAGADDGEVRGHDHGRQRPLGAEARAAADRGSRGRRRRGQGTAARRGRVRRRGADRVLVLDRELVTPARRGRGPDADVSRANRS